MKALLAMLTIFALAACASPKGGTSKSTSTASSTGSAVASKSASLSWTASTGLPTGYLVLQSNDGVTYASVATTTATSVAVGNLSSGTTYYFEVKAFNGGGYSPASSVITLHP